MCPEATPGKRDCPLSDSIVPIAASRVHDRPGQVVAAREVDLVGLIVDAGNRIEQCSALQHQRIWRAAAWIRESNGSGLVQRGCQLDRRVIDLDDVINVASD